MNFDFSSVGNLLKFLGGGCFLFCFEVWGVSSSLGNGSFSGDTGCRGGEPVWENKSLGERKGLGRLLAEGAALETAH